MIIVDPNGVSYPDEWNVLGTNYDTTPGLYDHARDAVIGTFNAAHAGVKWLIDDWNRA